MRCIDTKNLLLHRHQVLGVCVRCYSCDHSVRYLGVQWTCDLKWNRHFESILKSCGLRLFLIRKLKSILPADKLWRIYNSLIVSRIQYAAPLFVGLSETISEELEKFQRRAHRIVCSKTANAVYSRLSKKTENVGRLIFSYKLKLMPVMSYMYIN